MNTQSGAACIGRLVVYEAPKAKECEYSVKFSLTFAPESGMLTGKDYFVI